MVTIWLTCAIWFAYGAVRVFACRYSYKKEEVHANIIHFLDYGKSKARTISFIYLNAYTLY